MNILVLNSGSSSVKFQLIRTGDESLLAKGVIEKIGSTDAIITYQPEGRNRLREIREVRNHDVAIDMILSLLLHPQHGIIGSKSEIDGVGHRVVHGGEDFSDSVLITEDVKTTLRKCIQLAPLHNPHNLKGIEACESLLPGTPQVAVFDTAFHQTIPPKAFLYGLPYVLYKKHRIRRYGFHGTSHRYVAQRAADILKRPIESLKLITCHLGNGASIAAVDGGRSVDTTMGFTPLEGLIMGTRCGSIDPALVPYLMEREKLGPKEIDSIMNKNSGMLGLTETSNDMREIEQEAARGSERHQLAIEMYCYRIRGYIGSFMAVLGRADAVVFTGGIGENSRVVRRLVTEGLDALGLAVDPAKNEKNETDISAGSVKVLVVPTNEELAIARDTRRMLETAREAKPAASAEPEVKASVDFRPEETAALVLAWARNPGADFGILAGELSLCLKRTLDARAVERELRRLCLVSGEPSLKPLKKKSTKA